MKTDEKLPSLDIIKSLKKIGYISPEDRAWIYIDLPINNQAFLKWECSCLKNYFNKKREGGIEIILKPFCYMENRERKIFFSGQCRQCQKVYFTTKEAESPYAEGTDP